MENNKLFNEDPDKMAEDKSPRRKKYEPSRKLIISLLFVTAAVLLVNMLQINSLQDSLSAAPTVGTAGASGQVNQAGNTAGNQISGAAVVKLTNGKPVIPQGAPKIYGSELGISFDDVSPQDQQKADTTIRKLGQLDQTITLNEKDKKRYISILYELNSGISCEYCCGARSIIFDTGEPACGCAHSYAMRGLVKYLITKHGAEFTDEQIQEELGKWKTLFFPGQIGLKAEILASKGVSVDYVSLTSNKYRGAEKGAQSGGGMVGGC